MTTNSIIKEDLKFIHEAGIDWNRFKNKTVFISGANGFLPAYMVESLLYAGIVDATLNVRVIILVRNADKAHKRFKDYLNLDNFKILVQDVCSKIEMEDKVDFIIHAASQASPKYYGVDPVGTLNANVLGTINLMELAHKNAVESFLYFSSGDVYGTITNTDTPVKETDFGPLDPTNLRACYGESKRMGETICISWHHQFGVKAKIIRLAHTYGPGMSLDDGRSFADFVSDVVHKRDIVLNSDGSATRPFCYLADATIAYFLVLLNGENANAYNICNADGVISMKDLANLIVAIKPDYNLKVVIKDTQNTDVNSYYKSPVQKAAILDSSKIMALGWQPKTTIEEGFRRTVNSYISAY